jgi:hypothetical protein
LSSTACQNNHKEKLYAPVAYFVGFGNVSEAKTGLQNRVPDDLIAGVHTPSLFQRSVISPMDTSWDISVHNNETGFYLCTNKAYMSVWIERGGTSVHENPKNELLHALSPSPLPAACLGKNTCRSWMKM